MSDFVNTIDLIGDDALTDGLISGTLTELRDDRVRVVPSSRFNGNTSLVTIEFPNVTEVGQAAFGKMTALTTISLPKLTRAPGWLFEACTSLTTVNLPSLTSDDQNMFVNCTALTKMCFENDFTTYGGLFSGCTSLRIVDFRGYVSFANHSAFYNCANLTALIFRSDRICSLPGSSNLSNSGIISGLCYFYVPRSLVDSYKAETNWSAYVDRIRPLEDYTVDGTLTGEFDETKI